MKRITLLMMLLLSVAGLQAKDLVVALKNGQKITFSLSDNPVITYAGTTFKAVGGSNEVTTDLSNVQKYYFEDSPTTGFGTTTTRPTLQNGTALFSGLPTGTLVSLYATDGRLLHSAKANSNGDAHISFGQYPAGTYVITAGSAIIKVVNK